MPHYPYDAFRMFYVKIFSYFASNNISQTKSYIVMWICLIPSFFFYFSTVHQIHSVNKSIFEAYLFGGIPVRKLILPFICIILSNSYQTFPKWTCWLKTYLWPTSSKKKKKIEEEAYRIRMAEWFGFLASCNWSDYWLLKLYGPNIL